MEPFVQKDKSYYLIPEWEAKYPNVIAGFTTKHGGFSSDSFESLNMGFHVDDRKNSVCQNRLILSEKLKFPLEQWVGAEQTHETKIRKVNKSDKGKGSHDYGDSFKQTDGFYTSESGLLLTLCFADCVPLYFIAPQQRIIGAAHAGWRGTVAGIGREMISCLSAEGVKPSEVHVAIGPSICEKCYVVDDYVVSHLQNKVEDVTKNTYNLIDKNQYQLNLPKLNKQILMDAGVLEENIMSTNLCTSCNHELFFSHRKDQGTTGRMISFIGWKEA